MARQFTLKLETMKIKAPEWCEPIRALLPNAPKWLRRYKFITHRKLSAVTGEWNLTELSTGLAVVQGKRSRKLAIKAGMERILNAGCKKFRSKVAEAKSHNADISDRAGKDGRA